MAEDEGGVEALRRRVYGAGATDEDRARYAAALSAPPPPAADVPQDEGPAPGATAGPARRRLGPPLAVAAVVLVAVVAVLLLRPSPPPGPAPTSLPVDADTRAELIRNLRIGKDAGVAAYLTVEPAPASIRDATPTAVQEGRGSGPGSLRLALPAAATRGGRMTVLVVLADGARVRWTAEAAGGRALRERAADQDAGDLTSDTSRYAGGDPPVRLRVDVPAGVAWGAGVVLTD